MATTTAVSPLIDQAENLAVMGLVVYLAPEDGPPEEVLSAPSWSLDRPIPRLTVVGAKQADGRVSFTFSAPDLFGLMPSGSIGYVVGKAAGSASSFDDLPPAPCDIFSFQPPAVLEATVTVTLSLVSSIHGAQSFPFTIRVTGSFDTSRDRLIAAVAALGS